MSLSALVAAKALQEDQAGVAIGHSHKLVLLLVADSYLEATGYAHPSMARLAAESGFSVRHLRRVLKDMDERGLIALEPATDATGRTLPSHIRFPWYAGEGGGHGVTPGGHSDRGRGTSDVRGRGTSDVPPTTDLNGSLQRSAGEQPATDDEVVPVPGVKKLLKGDLEAIRQEFADLSNLDNRIEACMANMGYVTSRNKPLFLRNWLTRDRERENRRVPHRPALRDAERLGLVKSFSVKPHWETGDA